MNEPLQLPSGHTQFPEGEVYSAETPIDPYGRKGGYQSWQQTIRRISQMKASELKTIYANAIDYLDSYGNITLRELAIIKAFESVIANPNPAMLGLIMERDEGKVPNTVMSASGNITDWMEYAKENNIEIDAVMEEAKRIMDEYNRPPSVIEGEIVD